MKVTRQMDGALAFAGASENGSATQFYAGDVNVGELRRLSYSSGKAL